MNPLQRWLKDHTFQVYSIAFLVFTISAILMYTAAQRDATSLIWVLIGIVVAGHVIVILTP